MLYLKNSTQPLASSSLNVTGVASAMTKMSRGTVRRRNSYLNVSCMVRELAHVNDEEFVGLLTTSPLKSKPAFTQHMTYYAIFTSDFSDL
jgi:hypothetical protein